MEEGRVCLPGIGTLLVVEQPAMVSLIEGRASAPCARVAFNGNLVVDDGRLRREIGPEDAEAFVRQTRDSLEAGRTVLLDGIGKLYRHQDGDVRFSPGATNFSKESFGLPEINLKPIVRKEKPAAVPPRPSAAPNQEVVVAKSAWPMQYRGVLWYAAGLAGLLLVLYLLFRLGGAIGEQFATPDDRPTARERAPALVRPAEDAALIDANDVRPAAPPTLEPSATVVRPPEDQPIASQTNTAIIAIGLYARQRNVDKQVRRLSEAGYTPFTEEVGRNTRLGVEVTYSDESRLRQVLREIRARYTSDAFVMRVNGEERRPEQR
ncbi:hypothetical protein CLV84_3448 [Neolewinella xylanilytica]|uniref:Sporulation related protein n=2 Tax=Neolewinella xylanilytica TaxID=1514080 RepID=A0A2S6I5R4_9BACT|nr:hypothetical protein CLV84_3448 [Neolewinella xylanilytica]